MAIEADRIARIRDRQREEGLGFSDGFARKPPRALGRSGRKAFRVADRANRAQWWERRRNRDGDTRAIGVLVLTLLIVGYIAYRLIWGGRSVPPSADSARPAAASITAVASAQTAIQSLTIAQETGEQSASTTAPSSGSVGGAAVPTAPAAPSTGPVEVSVFGNGANTSTVLPAVTGSSRLPTGVATVITAPVQATGTPAPVGPVAPADRRTAQSAALAWFQRTCGSSWRQPFGTAVTVNRQVMTSEGWAYADPARDLRGAQWWKGVVRAQQTRLCANVAVGKFTGPAPTGPATATLVFTADRIVTSERPGFTAVIEKITELRTMTLGRDQLWSVGPILMAG